MATVAELCGFLNVPAPEHPLAAHELTRVSAIATAGTEVLVFASDAETLAAAIASSAGLILSTQGLEHLHDDPRVFSVRDPRTDFARAYHRFFRVEPPVAVHPSATIADDAHLGPGTSVGPGAVIEAGVTVGAACRIGPGAILHTGTTLGDRVIVQAGAVLGSTGFGYVHAAGKYLSFPQIGTLVIGDDVEIGANTTIDRGALGETRIGQGTKMDNLVHIAHNCVIGERVLIAAQVGMAGSTVIEDGAMLGGQVGLGERVTVGRGVILGGQGGVLPGKRIDGQGVVYWGTPAQPVREYLRDLARLRRR